MDELKRDEKGWEPVISTEVGEMVCCDRCKAIIESKVVGEHLYCERCSKFIWRQTKEGIKQ